MLRYALAFVALGAAPALAQDAPKCELDRPVVFGSLNWDSAQFHGAVAEYIIKHGYGCETDSIPGDTIPLINGVARGDADLVMEIWTANPAEAWVEAEAAGQTVALGATFPDASEGWFVPTSIVSGAERRRAGPQVGRRSREIQGAVRRSRGAGKGPLLQLPGRLALRGGELEEARGLWPRRRLHQFPSRHRRRARCRRGDRGTPRQAGAVLLLGADLAPRRV